MRNLLRRFSLLVAALLLATVLLSSKFSALRLFHVFNSRRFEQNKRNSSR